MTNEAEQMDESQRKLKEHLEELRGKARNKTKAPDSGPVFGKDGTITYTRKNQLISEVLDMPKSPITSNEEQMDKLREEYKDRHEPLCLGNIVLGLDLGYESMDGSKLECLIRRKEDGSYWVWNLKRELIFEGSRIDIDELGLPSRLHWTSYSDETGRDRYWDIRFDRSTIPETIKKLVNIELCKRVDLETEKVRTLEEQFREAKAGYEGAEAVYKQRIQELLATIESSRLKNRIRALFN